GVLAVHISNRYLKLEPVLANIAAELGLAGVAQSDDEGDVLGKAASHWVVLARRPEVLDPLVPPSRRRMWEQGWDGVEAAPLTLAVSTEAGAVQAAAQLAAYKAVFDRQRLDWRPLRTRPEVGVWTDDYSNLLRVL